MIIDMKTVVQLTRELINAMKELTDELGAFRRELSTLEVKQDAIDLALSASQDPTGSKPSDR